MTDENATPRRLASAPPDSVPLDGVVVVRRYAESDAATLRDAVTLSIEHLRPWMPWIAHEPQTVEQRRALISEWNRNWDQGVDFVMGIFEGHLCIGGTGFHLRGPEGSVEVGYWLAASHVGRGIITRAVTALTETALSMPEVTVVEIVTDEANERSAAVARRCGYELVERFTRQREAPGEKGIGLRWRRT